METERKYLDVDFSFIREKLQALGAETSGPHFESNIVMDTLDLSLRKAKSLLRLRTQQWTDRVRYRLTFKCLSQSAVAAGHANVKAREEFETEIASRQEMLAILVSLGFVPTARYEKVRESWRLAMPDGLCEIDLDILPFADIMEIEAEPALIDHVARLLGVDKYKISLKNYYELNQEWREVKNLPPASDILFDQQEKKRILASLGLMD